MHENVKQVPESYRSDIERAVKIATDAGCTNIYLFGSLKDGVVHSGSDIDLAVRGCPPGGYFSLWSKLIFSLQHPVDLVNLDLQEDLDRFLSEQGELIPIG